MNDAVAKYVRGLPVRWLFGGFLLGVVWMAPSVVQHGYSKGFQGQGPILQTAFAKFVSPLCVIGFLWGWSERLKLERSIASGNEQFDRAIRRIIAREIGKGVICGVVFILFIFGAGFLLTFRPWDNEDNILSNIGEISTGFFGGAVVGLFVGVVAKGNLQRKSLKSSDAMPQHHMPPDGSETFQQIGDATRNEGLPKY
jgi:hypothetical protein